MSVAAPPTPCSPQGSLGIWSLGRRRLRGPLLDSAGHVGPRACPEGAGAVVRRERRVRVMDRSPGSEGFLQEAPAGLPRRVWCRAHGASLAQGQKFSTVLSFKKYKNEHYDDKTDKYIQKYIWLLV